SLAYGGCGLVANQEALADGKCTGNLDHLALLNGEVPCEAVDVQVEAPVEHDLARARSHGTPVDDIVVIPCRAIEEDVFGDCKTGHYHRLLVNARDQALPAGAIRQSWCSLSPEPDNAAIRPDQAGEDRHPGGLPGAVAPNQSGSLNGPDAG